MDRGSLAERVLGTDDPGPLGLLATGWLLWLCVGAWAITPASVLPVVMTDLAIGETAAAWIITAPQIAAVVGGIPVGMALDRVDNGRAVLLSIALLLVVGLGNTVLAGAEAYGALLGTRVLGGLGLVTIWIAQTATITRSFPAVREATAVGLFVTGYPAGYAFGQFTGPLIAGLTDWSVTFAAYATAGFAFGVAFWLVDRQMTTTDAGGTAPSGVELRRALRSRGVWGVGLLSLLSYMIYMVFNGWMPTYLARTYEIDLALGGVVTALFPAIGILARPGGGLLSENVFDGRSLPVIAISFLSTGAIAAALGFGGTLAVMAAGLVGAGFAIQLQFGLLYTLVQRYVPRNVGGTAVSVVSAVGWLGTFVGPPIVGAIIETTESYVAVFATAVVLAVLGTGTILVLSEPAVR